VCTHVYKHTPTHHSNTRKNREICKTNPQSLPLSKHSLPRQQQALTMNKLENPPGRVHMYTHTVVHIHVYAYIYTETHTCIHIHMHMHICTHTCTHIYTYMYMHIYTRTALPTFEAFPVLSESAPSFRTVTSITQKDGFQCAVICIGNIIADASNKPGRFLRRYCKSIRKYIGLLLWLNSQQPIVLLQEHMTLLAQNSPSGSVIGTGHQSPRFIPGPSASVLTHMIIRLMIQEIGDTPPVTTVPLLLPKFSPEEPSINPLVSTSGHGDESDSDCQIQEGPEPDSSTALASDSLGQPRGTRPA